MTLRTSTVVIASIIIILASLTAICSDYPKAAIFLDGDALSKLSDLDVFTMQKGLALCGDTVGRLASYFPKRKCQLENDLRNILIEKVSHGYDLSEYLKSKGYNCTRTGFKFKCAHTLIVEQKPKSWIFSAPAQGRPWFNYIVVTVNFGERRKYEIDVTLSKYTLDNPDGKSENGD